MVAHMDVQTRGGFECQWANGAVKCFLICVYCHVPSKSKTITSGICAERTFEGADVAMSFHMGLQVPFMCC